MCKTTLILSILENNMSMLTPNLSILKSNIRKVTLELFTYNKKIIFATTPVMLDIYKKLWHAKVRRI